MIQQQSYLDIAGQHRAKQAMCIKVLRGSSSKGKFKRKVAGVGDVIICAVKKTPGRRRREAGVDHPLRRRRAPSSRRAARTAATSASTRTRR
jgi:ribosomal protein L14